MTQERYPKPDRSDFVPNVSKDRGAVVDLGWAEGIFSDGRPYRIEQWRKGPVTVVSCFFSTKGIEGWGREDLRRYLEEEDVLFFAAPFQFVEAAKITDPSGNELWSVNIAETEGDVSYVESKVELLPYENK